MASSADFIEFLYGQIAAASEVRYRKMFGEYCLYCNDKVIGLVCDNQFFFFFSESGRRELEKPLEVPPFEGAKNWFLIEDLDNEEFLTSLVYQTWLELPEVKQKAKLKKRKAKTDDLNKMR